MKNALKTIVEGLSVNLMGPLYKILCILPSLVHSPRGGSLTLTPPLYTHTLHCTRYTYTARSASHVRVLRAYWSVVGHALVCGIRPSIVL